MFDQKNKIIKLEESKIENPRKVKNGKSGKKRGRSKVDKRRPKNSDEYFMLLMNKFYK